MEAKIALPPVFNLDEALKEIRLTIEEIKTGIGHHQMAATSLSIQNVRQARQNHESAADSLQAALLAAQLIESRLVELEKSDGR